MRPNLTVTCRQCGVPGNQIRRDIPFCSSRCRVLAANQGVYLPCDAERFSAKTAADGDCIIFFGDLNHAGYGAFYVGKYSVRAHRFAWLMAHGPIPANVDVSHQCHRRACVNLAHLYLAPHQENMDHSTRDGRMARGERHGRVKAPELWPRGENIPGSKLTEAQVIEIRRRYRKGKRGAGCPALGRMYGVSHETIRAIVTGETWAHVSATT